MPNLGVSISVMVVAVVCVLVMIFNRNDPTPIGWAAVIAIVAAVIQVINLRGLF